MHFSTMHALRELYLDLQRDGRPSLAWVIHWSDGGKRDPVEGAWMVSEDCTPMMWLARMVGRSREVNAAMRAAGRHARLNYLRTSTVRERALAIRAAVKPPTIAQLIEARERLVAEFRASRGEQ